MYVWLQGLAQKEVLYILDNVCQIETHTFVIFIPN